MRVQQIFCQIFCQVIGFLFFCSQEQISVSVKYDVDFVAIETIWDYGEASIALKVCNEVGELLLLLLLLSSSSLLLFSHLFCKFMHKRVTVDWKMIAIKNNCDFD